MTPSATWRRSERRNCGIVADEGLKAGFEGGIGATLMAHRLGSSRLQLLSPPSEQRLCS